jgi:hypothetical protein
MRMGDESFGRSRRLLDPENRPNIADLTQVLPLPYGCKLGRLRVLAAARPVDLRQHGKQGHLFDTGILAGASPPRDGAP